ncbi:MAG TPA: Hsp20 family protein [Methanobacterium sp.]|jgi:HSP20 family protein|nr:MAG: Hsp20 family protein [Methanobacterium sp.]HOI71317.1 Hsp20 family protein [Methanobacterium sp.]
MTRRNVAEQVFNDVFSAIKESQTDLEKTVSGYASGIIGKTLVDVIDQGNVIIVKADLPGFKKENIKIELGSNNLEIIALFDEDALGKGANYVRRERRYSEVKRAVELPTSIIIDQANAELENGVLQITLPKLGRTEVNVE